MAQPGTEKYQNAPMLDSEKEAFYSVLEALAGESNAINLYPDPCGLTPVPGTSCDLFGDFWYITALYVGAIYDNSPKCSKNAVLDPSIFSLSHLKTLSFYSCFVNAPQVMPLNRWTNLAGSLKSLIFQNNVALVGELPHELGNLENLESLVVTESSMKGNLPMEIGNLTKLRKLVLSHNLFYGMIPPSLGHLRELLIMDLSFNALQGPIPATFGSMNSLVKMDLSDNGLQEMIPRTLGNLKSLTFLDLRNNQLHGNLPGSLIEMENLQELYLSNNPLGGPIDSLHWGNLQSLISLDLASSDYIGTIPESFGELKTLRYLALNDNNLTGKVPSALANLPNVCSLLLNSNNLSGPLEFPSKFYERMGRYLALWGNPRLCYVTQNRNFAPNGVTLCSGVVRAGKSHGTSMNSVVGYGARSYNLRTSVISFASLVLSFILEIFSGYWF